MTRRRKTWNEMMSSMGSLRPLKPDLIIALKQRYRGNVVALKVKAPSIGSFAPLRTSIDMVTVLDVSQAMTGSFVC
ncbi:hypothetical protein MUK42_05879 [Musa troglodytarum]|nr:hypothetical protein MUK42_05879 [Musa troglodytarum]